ncbi:MAG: DUF1501 domain-containing protein [Acidobacteria bacterium]|nr:DUF1501 domain-containing protein [Acidobacteriota bacterium]
MSSFIDPDLAQAHRIRRELRRRDVLRGAANGFGALALQSLLARDGHAAPKRVDPLEAKTPHFAPKAKSVIFLFNVGAPSSMDTFDPKPKLTEMHGRPMPESMGKVGGQFTDGSQPIFGSPWEFKPRGQSGMPISTLFPHVAQHADDLCVVRSFTTRSVVHAPAMYEVHCGRLFATHPSMGAWVTYGLGSESDNLPAYVVMPQPEGTPEGGPPCWGAAFLPAVYQGTLLRPGPTPILHLERPPDMTESRQRRTLDLLQKLNEMDAGQDSEMAARISSYELAFRMQAHAPEAVDLQKETPATREMYGLNQDHTRDFGTRLLLARRMVERGVRFVQVYSGGGPIFMQWDAHQHLVANHEKMAGHTDQPIGALLTDLKQRGLLDETLVVWGAEFGRLPTSQSGNGRDHNPYGFTMWFAGGGTKGGRVIGATDDFGLRAVEKPYTMRDFHATLLHLLGLDQHQLWYLHNGRHEKLVDFGGNLIEEVYA